MSAPAFAPAGARAVGREPADVDIVIPVYNEEAALEWSVRRLHAYVRDRFPLSWAVTIVDNASTDGTWRVASELASELDGVRALHLDRKGRGLALRSAWLGSDSPVLAYMDVDLSTDLDALLPLVAPLVSGHSDLAIGSRLAPGAQVTRGPKREVLSRVYNLILKATLRNGFSDAQCGFKAVRGDVARRLLPMVEDNAWFFDTELLVLADYNGLRIHEVPVDWVDDPDSRVEIRGTAVADLRGVGRMMRRLAAGDGVLPAEADDGEARPSVLTTQLVRFAGIGLLSTLAFAALFAALAAPLGPFGAAVGALALCAAPNLAANRRLTFVRRGPTGRARHYLGGLVLAVLPLALSLSALAVLHAAGVTSIASELATVTAVNAAATVARFVAFRRWVFRG